MATLADALRQCGPAYLVTHALNTSQAKAWRAIVACRTPALGGQRLQCNQCGHSHWQYHSCRNRHCPQCGARAKDAWLQGRISEVLNVPYVHLVLTLPHSLNGLYGAHPRWVIDTLFASAAQTLSEFAASPKWMGVKDGTPAFSLVLHTWGQQLQRHIHVHAVMACGVLEYLSRYTHRTAIGNERIRAVTDSEVAFTVRADDRGGKRLHRLEGTEFVRRYLQHVLPGGIKRIRHYGVLASACKGSKLNAARLALQMPQPNAKAMESAQAYMARVAGLDVGLCPACKTARLRTVEVLAPAKRLPTPGENGWPQERGPP